MECQGSGTPRKGGIWHVQRCPVKTGNCKDQEMLAGKEEERLLRGEEADEAA